MGKLVRITLEEAKGVSSRTDWERVDAMTDLEMMTDLEIERAIREEVDSVPELTEAWFKNA